MEFVRYRSRISVYLTLGPTKACTLHRCNFALMLIDPGSKDLTLVHDSKLALDCKISGIIPKETYLWTVIRGKS